jgi:hypothetical protein
MAAKRTTLFGPATAIVGSGNSIDFEVSTGSMMDVTVILGTGSGTITDLDVWMESTNEGEGAVNFHRIHADTIDANGTDVVTPRSNIVNNKTTTTAEIYGAVFKHLPAGRVRARWNLTGTTPSIPLTVQIGVK